MIESLFHSRKIRLATALAAMTVWGGSSDQCHGDPVVPGGDTKAPTTILPVLLGFDSGNSVLYVVDESGTDSHPFGSIDPESGVFTQIALIPATFGFATTNISIDPISEHIYALRDDAWLSVDLSTGAVATYPRSPDTGNANYDSQSNELQTNEWSVNGPHGFFSETPSSGAQTLLSSYNLSGELGAGVAAIDPLHHIFYSQELTSQSTLNLVEIDERTGSTTKLPQSSGLLGLAFDSKTATLYGITVCGYTPTFELVKIDTKNGAMSTVASLGDCSHQFSDAAAAALVDDERFYVTDYNGSTAAIVGADVSANRSWYVNASVGESDKAIQNWMYSAGHSLGLRAQQLPTTQMSHIILDFGAPVTRTKKGAVSYGASGFGRFMAVDLIEKLVVQYAQGFHDGALPSNRVSMVVGTNSSGKSVTHAHGMAWGEMVSSVNSDLAQKALSAQVQAVAGTDAEVEWKPSPSAVRDWVAAINGGAADFGDATDCTLNKNQCKNGWTKADVASVSSAGAWPEIYNINGKQATQWAAVSAYEYGASGKPLNFVAPLSQLEDCLQTKASDCIGANNSPMAAWTQLSNALRKQFGKGTPLPESSTDIEWRMLP